MEIQWNDNVKSRRWNEKLTNTYSKKGKEVIRSQEVIYDYLLKR